MYNPQLNALIQYPVKNCFMAIYGLTCTHVIY
jgi:hypothetical protein